VLYASILFTTSVRKPTPSAPRSPGAVVVLWLRQVRNGKGAIAPGLGPLLDELKSNFTVNHQSCLLYVASEVIKVGTPMELPL